MVFAKVVIGISARTGTGLPNAASKAADRTAHRIGGSRLNRRAATSGAGLVLANADPDSNTCERQMTTANNAREIGPQTRGDRRRETMSGYSTDRRASTDRPVPADPGAAAEGACRRAGCDRLLSRHRRRVDGRRTALPVRSCVGARPHRYLSRDAFERGRPGVAGTVARTDSRVVFRLAGWRPRGA